MKLLNWVENVQDQQKGYLIIISFAQSLLDILLKCIQFCKKLMILLQSIILSTSLLSELDAFLSRFITNPNDTHSVEKITTIR